MTRGIAGFALVLAGGLSGCSERQSALGRQTTSVASDSSDSVYAEIQERGRVAMGVDQYTSRHRFESLTDGGRITLERDPADTVGVAQIRSHMRDIADSFHRGSFVLPGFVHNREVPGTRVMRARRSLISYTPTVTAAGGQLRILSRDSAAISAIHEFLDFQRRDHRSGPGHESHR